MKSRAIILSFHSLFLLSAFHCFSQSVDYDKQRVLLNQHIDLLNQNLKNTTKEIGGLTKDYSLIKRTIENREELNHVINKELAEIDSLSTMAKIGIDNMAKQKEKHLQQLEMLMRKEYYQKLSTNIWVDLFSSGGIKERFVKWRYNAQIRDFIDNNIHDIETITAGIQDSIMYMERVKTEKLALLQEESSNMGALQNEYENSKRILGEIKNEEKRIRNLLDIQQQEAYKINQIVGGVIERESVSDDNYKVDINYSFVNEKGKLNWPVAAGAITERFGVQSHESVRGVKTKNSGIDLICPPASPVRSVHAGKVLLVTNQPPYNNIIIVSHGDYVSAYYHLEHVQVAKDEEVDSNKLLGFLKAGDTTVEFHFEIWFNQNQVNPEHWLKNR